MPAPPPVEFPHRTHVYQSSLHASPQNNRRSFDALFKKTQPPPPPTTKDQALADQRLVALLRQKGSQILRQRLLYLLRKQFQAEFERNDTCGLLHSVEDLIITTDNTDATMITYLKQFSSKANVAEQPCLSTERMSSMPSFILTGPSQLAGPAATGGASGAGVSVAASVEVDSTTGDEADVDQVEKEMNNFYTMLVKRVPGTGTVFCPYCSKSLDEVPVVTPNIVTEDVGTNTVERPESEKDSLLAILTKTKNECEKKVEDLRKELANLKKAKYTSQNLQINPAMLQSGGGGGSVQTPTSLLLPGFGSLVHDDSPLSSFLGKSSSSGGEDLRAHDLPPRASSVMSGSASSKATASSSSGGTTANSNNNTAREPPLQKLKRAASGILTRTSSSTSLSVGGPASLTAVTTTGGGGGVGIGLVSGDTIQIRVGHLSRFLVLAKELRAKLNAIRSGVRAFQHKDVLQQVGHHVLPQLHALQSTNKRLLERDYLLEKLILDTLCKVGTMPDIGSPEGYLPEGGPLHVGTYSLLDDRRFFEWTRRISDALTAKVNAVQSYISNLSNEARFVTDTTSSARKEVTLLEDRCSNLESSLIENECFNVSNILDHTFDSSTSIQPARKPEFVSLLKQAAETNEEIRLVYVLPNWAQRGQLRAKVNMWRQRRMDTLQRIEHLLSQEMQSSMGSGAQKIILKGKLMTLRELIQIASRLHLMPNLRPAALVRSPPPAGANPPATSGGKGAATGGATPTGPDATPNGDDTSAHEPRVQSAGSDAAPTDEPATPSGAPVSPVSECISNSSIGGPSVASSAGNSGSTSVQPSVNGGATALGPVRSPLVKRRQSSSGPASPTASKLPPMNNASR